MLSSIAVSVLCLGSTISIDTLGVRILPWHVLLFPLAAAVIRFEWRAVTPLVRWALVGFALVAGSSAFVAVQTGADLTVTARSTAMLMTDLVLVSLFVGCPARWLPMLRNGLFAGLVFALAGGILEACGLYRFPGSHEILGPSAVDAPPSVAVWAEFAPAFGFGNPNNYAAGQVVLASLVLMSARTWLALLPAIWFVVIRTDSDLAILCLAAISGLAIVRAPVILVATLGAGALLYGMMTLLSEQPPVLGSAIEKISEISDRIGRVLTGTDPRVQLTITAFHTWMNAPLIGAGPGGSSRVLPAMVAGSDIDHLGALHNQLAIAFVETGLIGGAALAVLLMYPFRVLAKARQSNGATARSAPTLPNVVVAQCCTAAAMFCASDSISVWPWWLMIGLLIRSAMPSPPKGTLRRGGDESSTSSHIGDTLPVTENAVSGCFSALIPLPP